MSAKFDEIVDGLRLKCSQIEQQYRVLRTEPYGSDKDCIDALAILDRLADDELAERVAKGNHELTDPSRWYAIDEYRKRLGV